MTAEQNPAVTGARIREPAGFWEWCAAVDELAQEDGVQATAHAWALHCVSWKGDQCRLRTPHVGVEELARRRRRDRTAIRRHLVALEDLGLLELVQRHGHGRKRLYLARVPIGYGAPGAPVPLPGLEGATYRAAAPGNPETLTGQQRPVIPGSSARLYRAAAPGSPSIQSSQTSSRETDLALPGSSARLPGQEEEVSQGEEVSREVLDRLRAKVPAVMAQADVAARRRIGADVRTLHGIGWQPDELVCELTRATFDSTHRPVGVLIKRLDALLEAGQPGLWQLHSEEAERQAQLEQQQARRAGEDARDAQQRAEAERWADELAAALPGDKLDELLDLVVAEHHAHLVGRGVSMRRGAARAWLREEYDAAGDVALPAFLTELRAKLDRAPHTTTVAQ